MELKRLLFVGAVIFTLLACNLSKPVPVLEDPVETPVVDEPVAPAGLTDTPVMEVVEAEVLPTASIDRP